MGLSNFHPSTHEKPADFTIFIRQYNVGTHQFVTLLPY
jgi:hypothetical protein